MRTEQNPSGCTVPGSRCALWAAMVLVVALSGPACAESLSLSCESKSPYVTNLKDKRDFIIDTEKKTVNGATMDSMESSEAYVSWQRAKRWSEGYLKGYVDRRTGSVYWEDGNIHYLSFGEGLCRKNSPGEFKL